MSEFCFFKKPCIAEEPRKTRGRLCELCGHMAPQKNRGRQRKTAPRRTVKHHTAEDPGTLECEAAAGNSSTKMEPLFRGRLAEDSAEDSQKTRARICARPWICNAKCSEYSEPLIYMFIRIRISICICIHRIFLTYK